MSAKLICHTPESIAGGISPFDDAIVEMIDGQELCIASPYLGLVYLQRMIKRAVGWRLLTDVQEWLSSHTHSSRHQITDFIMSNSERIRHCRDLHAKVLIAGRKAFTGSANFTDKGITKRVEVSVLFENCDQVEELRNWFELLWGETAPVAEVDLQTCVTSLPPPATSGTAALPCAFPGVDSKLRKLETKMDTNAPATHPESEQELLDSLNRKDVNEIDRAQKHKVLRDSHGWSDARIARECKYGHQATVTQLWKLLELEPKYQDHVRNGEITKEAGITLSEVSPNDRERVYSVALEQSQKRGNKSNKVRGRAVNEALSQLRDERKKAANEANEKAKEADKAAKKEAAARPGSPEAIEALKVAAVAEALRVVRSEELKRVPAPKELSLKQFKDKLATLSSDNKGSARVVKLCEMLTEWIAGTESDEEVEQWILNNIGGSGT